MERVSKPYGEAEKKKEQVAAMFDNIAGKYDFLNHFLSLNIDKHWRKKAIAELLDTNPKEILDIASGTGDFAIGTAKKLRPEKITGIDISEKMLEKGRVKIRKHHLEHIIELQKGDSEKIEFPDASFDAASVAFGVRNFENIEKALSDIKRVLKPGSKLVILEFSIPEKKGFRTLYCFYFNKILPFFGRIFSKDKKAYTYLPESVKAFPHGADFTALMKNAGFNNTQHKALCAGIASIYTGFA